jgi:hypothetical protein
LGGLLLSISVPSTSQNEFLINEKWGEELELYEK